MGLSFRSALHRFSVHAHPMYRRSEYSVGPVEQRLLRLARRWQHYRTFQDAPRVIFVVSGLSVVLGVLAAAFIPAALSIVVTVLVITFGGLTLAARLLVVPPVREVALAYDRRLQLRERLSTAVVPSLHEDPEIRRLQQNDAIRVLDAVDESSSFPYALHEHGKIFLVIAAGALGGWLLVVVLGWAPGKFALRADADLLAAVPKSGGAQTQTDRRPPVDPRIEQLRYAISELKQQRDSRAVDAAAAFQEASESLRLTSEGRHVGRALASGDFRPAVAAIHDLASQASGLTRASQENLAEGFRQASLKAKPYDSDFAARLEGVADALERGRISDARSAMDNLASEVKVMGVTVETNNQIDGKVRGLERQLAAAIGTSDVSGSLVGSVTGKGTSSSASGGTLVDGDIEALSSKERLSVEGRLEVVRIEPVPKGTELKPYRLNDVGPSNVRQQASYDVDGGVAVGRRDFSRVTPIDFLPTIYRYFSSK